MLTKGKLLMVTRAHNGLHELLGRYAQAAKAIELTPSLKLNDITQGPVALTMHALGMARSTTVLMCGLELYLSAKNLATGPNSIADFLCANPPETRSMIPAPFWQMLEPGLRAQTHKLHDNDPEEGAEARTTTARRGAQFGILLVARSIVDYGAACRIATVGIVLAQFEAAPALSAGLGAAGGPASADDLGFEPKGDR